jgi:ABC-type lipoprotein release transport system permease subunit
VRETDPLTFAATAGILLAVAALATLAPALRILRMDPAETLRNE